MRRRVHFVAIAPVTAALAILVPLANAQQCANDGSGEAIQCRVGNVLSKNGSLLSTLQARISSCDSTDPNCALLQRHLQRAQNAHTRAVNAHNHTSADNYNQLTANPHYHRNSKHTAGANGIQSVGSNTNAPDTLDSDYDATGTGSIGQTIMDSLDETSSALDDANTSLASLPQPSPPTFTPPSAYNFAADPGYPAWLHSIEDEKVKIPLHFGAIIAKNALDVAHDLAEHACGETLVAFGEGGNTKLACVALSLVHIAAISTVDLFDFADADSTYWNAKAGNMNAQLALQASNQIGNIAAGTSGDVSAIKAEVDALSLYVNSTLTPDLNKILANQATILANQATIMQLLSTPQGQRTGFPAK